MPLSYSQDQQLSAWPELTVIHVALVSVRGSLAFWRPADLIISQQGSATTATSTLTSEPFSPSGQVAATSSTGSGSGGFFNSLIWSSGLAQVVGVGGGGARTGESMEQQQQQALNSVRPQQKIITPTTATNTPIGHSKCSSSNLLQLASRTTNHYQQQLATFRNGNNNNHRSYSNSLANNGAEIVVVEGTTNLKLNFVIIIGRRQQAATQQTQTTVSGSGSGTTAQTGNSDKLLQQIGLISSASIPSIAYPSIGVGGRESRLQPEVASAFISDRKLKLYWSKNGDQLQVNSPKSRLTEQIINEEDIVGQYFSSTNNNNNNNNNNSTIRTTNQIKQTFTHQQQQQQHVSSPPGSGPNSFMLAPYVNDRLINLIDQQQQLQLQKSFNSNNNSDLKQIISNLLSKRLLSPQNSYSHLMPDDFLSDGHSIDWRKLEAYLRYYLLMINANDFHESTVSNNIDCSSSSSSKQQQQQQQHFEQLTVVQFELNRLSQEDRGFYQLAVCNSNSNNNNNNNNNHKSIVDMTTLKQQQQQQGCQYIGFNVRVVEDVPRWENKLIENKIVEVGDRLSIKCQATGFTLPQITWFLDGQQLNEHGNQLLIQTQLLKQHEQQQQQHHHQSIDNNNNNGKLRIGDYVTQDNHVHSFVNSSQIQAGDGGYYKCQANNGFHSIEQEIRIDVRGPPTISRQMPNISVLNNQNQLHIQCPYSGFPIHSIEWFYRPATTITPQQHRMSHLEPSDSLHNDNNQFVGSSSSSMRQFRLKRVPLPEQERRKNESAQSIDLELKFKQTAAGVLSGSDDNFSNNFQDYYGMENLLDVDKDLDPDKDEWLSQANSMTSPPSDSDYPDQMPDYPQPAGLLQPGTSSLPSGPEHVGLNDNKYTLNDDESLSVLNGDTFDQSSMLNDYSDIQMDLQQQQQQELEQQQEATGNRRKRDTTSGGGGGFGPANNKLATSSDSEWIKFPQGRRHQVHQNGTLVIHDVGRNDQGFYKCRALALPSSTGSSSGMNAQSTSGSLEANNNNNNNNNLMITNEHYYYTSSDGLFKKKQDHLIHSSENDLNLDDSMSTFSTSDKSAGQFLVANSNEFFLTVLVPPVISPFASSESLREGMRNFLTCSVIEGDSPVSLRWFKDDKPIEEYILENHGGLSNDDKQAHRIRVDASNEYTSTLYFSSVEFKDNGNYTCMASNKAASVNYTAKMPVNVPPKWIKAPKDIECVSGQNIVIDCQAQAHPNPRVWWEIGVHNSQQQQQQSTLQSGIGSSPSSASSNSLASYTDNHNHNHQLQSQLQLQLQNSGQKMKQTNGTDFSLHYPTLVAPPGSPSAQLQHPPNHYRTIISNSRIHILENASLVIKEITKFDQGYYLCQAANNFGSLSSLIKLIVNVGASFTHKYLIKYVKLNDRIEFDCDPIGQSPVDIIWYQHQHQINLSLNNTNSARNNNNNIQRQYFDNSLPSASISSYQLQTSPGARFIASSNHPPTSISSKSSERQTLFTGTIKTEIQHYSSSQTSSSLNSLNFLESTQQQHQLSLATKTNQEQILSPNEQQSTIQFEIIRHHLDNGLKSESVKLLINKAKRFHSADYVCQASNRYGSDEKVIKLLVQEPPDPVEEINVVQVESRSISISWLAPFNGNSLITSYTVEWAPALNLVYQNTDNSQQLHLASSDGQQAVRGKTTTTTGTNSNSKWSNLITQQASVTITGLQPMTSYEIRVRAQNQFGQSVLNSISFSSVAEHSSSSSWPPPMIVTTTEEAPTSPPKDIKAIALSSSTIQLSWIPPEGSYNYFEQQQQQQSLERKNETFFKQQYKYSIKGYYLGYKIANSNDSYVFKTVSLFDTIDSSSGSSLLSEHKQPATIQNEQQLMAIQDYSTTINMNNKLFLPTSGGVQNNNNNNNNKTIISENSNVNQEKMISRLRVVIGDLKRFTKYSIIVQAFNSAGPGPQSDQIEAKTLVNDPPPAPILRVGLVTYSSIEIQWSFQLNSMLASSNSNSEIFVTKTLNNNNNNNSLSNNAVDLEQQQASIVPAIEGYYLYYRSNDNIDWLEKRLTPETHTIIRLASSGVGVNPASGHQQMNDFNNNQLSIVELFSLQDQLVFASNKQAAKASTLQNEQKNELSSSSTSSNNNSNNKHSNVQIVGWSSNNLQAESNNNKTTTNDKDYSIQNPLAYLANKSFRFILDQLTCGTKYQIYLVAFNSIGSGLSSQIIRTKTRGSGPIAPRKQDYITLNSTFVQLNLDSWMDGGCSISNFEIKYKQAINNNNNNNNNNSISTLNTNQMLDIATGANKQQQQNNNNNQWLLVSSNISPEQRVIELRDLKPETWYSVLTIAESIAGKTEQHYNFMTLDKFGHLPAEAIEPPSNLPSLFKHGQAGFKTILLNSLVDSSFLNQALILSAFVCLIIVLFFLLLVKRYSSNMKDGASIDSQTTSGTNLFGNFHHHHNNNNNHHHHHSSPIMLSSSADVTHAHNNNSNNNINSIDHNNKINGLNIYGMGAGSQDYYSMRASPCKTSTTILTSSNATTNTTSGASESGTTNLNNEANNINLDNCPISDTYYQQQQQEAVANQQQYYQQQQLSNEQNICEYQQHQQAQFDQQALESDFCSAINCEVNHHLSPINKFATLSGRENLHNFSASSASPESQHILQQALILNHHNRFKTMPHSMSGNQTSRPVSTFIPNGQYQQASRLLCQQQSSSNTSEQYQLQQQQQQQQQQNQQQQQQIYSKLRLIYNANSNYNLCSIDNQKQNQNQLCANDNYNNKTGDAFNLTLMSSQQQNAAKLLGTLRKQSKQNDLLINNGSCSNQHHDNMMNENYTSHTTTATAAMGPTAMMANNSCNQVMENNVGANSTDLTSLLVDCQQNPNNTYYIQQFGANSNDNHNIILGSNGIAFTNNNNNNNNNNSSSSYAATTPSIASNNTNSTSTTTNSLQQTSSSLGSGGTNSCISGHNNEQQQQQHFLKLASNLLTNNNNINSSSPSTMNQQINSLDKSNNQMMPSINNSNNQQQQIQNKQLASNKEQLLLTGAQLPLSNNNSSSEQQQSDYALPIVPPKWV